MRLPSRPPTAVANLILALIAIGGWQTAAHGWGGTMSGLWDLVSANVTSTILMVLALSMLLWINFERIRTWFGYKPPAWSDNRLLTEAVTNWLLASGRTVQHLLQPPDATVVFTIAGVTEGGVSINVIRPRDGRLLLIVGDLKTTDEEFELLKAEEATHTEMQEELALELARLSVAFEMTFGVHKATFRLSDAIRLDVLTEEVFSHSIERMNRAVLIAVVVMRKHTRRASAAASQREGPILQLAPSMALLPPTEAP